MNKFGSQLELMICKSFLQKCSPKEQAELIQFLPESTQNQLSDLPFPEKITCGSYSDILQSIDISWIAPFLRKYSEKDIRLFLTTFQKEQAKKIGQLLGVSAQSTKITELNQEFLKEYLFQQLTENETIKPLPLTCIPDSSLNILLDLPLSQLQSIPRFLGLHDLSFEMRQIIDRIQIKRILAALNPEEQTYLQGILGQKEPLIIERLYLQKWDGQAKSLHQSLLTCGMKRLGKALHGENPQLLWHIAHRFDFSMGSKLAEYSEKKEPGKALQLLRSQVVKIAISMSESRKAL